MLDRVAWSLQVIGTESACGEEGRAREFGGAIGDRGNRQVAYSGRLTQHTIGRVPRVPPILSLEPSAGPARENSETRKTSLKNPTVAIIGAGPYGVSIAAHLRSLGVDFRIFGKSMSRWLHHMPKGMFLKSEPRASNLSDPKREFTLKHFCATEGLPYIDCGLAVPVEVFTKYAVWFQKRLASNVEDVMVTDVEQHRDIFELHLTNGETLTAASVIVATGMENTAYVPAALAPLPPELLSHTKDLHELSRFRGRDVAVIGAGQSALETAALLSEHGATVRLVIRKPSLVWNQAPKAAHRSPWHRLRHPASHLGAGLELWFCAEAPHLWRLLPQKLRLRRFSRVLGPAGAWWLRERVTERVRLLAGHSVVGAQVRGGRVVLQVAGEDGQTVDFTADHVVAATGYRFELQRLPFLSAAVKARLRTAANLPVLSSNFESTAPGLYFTGLASAASFGPAMRFIYGADYTARRVSRHLASGGYVRWSQPSLELAPITN